MSGPKISDYELERRRREQLRLQYLKEQERIRKYFRQQNMFKEGLQKSSKAVLQLLEKARASFEDLKKDKRCHISAEVIKQLTEQTQAAIQKCRAVHDKKEISQSEYNKCIRALEEHKQAWMGKIKELSNERMAMESDSFLRAMKVPPQKLSDDSRNDSSAQSDVETTLQWEKEFSRCIELLSDAMIELPEKENEIRKIQENLRREHTNSSETPKENLQLISYRYKELLHHITLWKREKEKNELSETKCREWIRLYRYYCTELRQPLMDVEQLEAKTESELEQLCATLDNKLYALYEENYIYKCIEEAMEEIGYQRYGQANNGVKGQFLYRMHGDTMVHVSCAESGIISMEIGIATKDSQRTLDVREVEDLVQDMHTFCKDYEEVRKRLTAKGVVLKNAVMLPPSAEYAHTLDSSQYTADLREQEDHVEVIENRYLTMEGERS